MNDHTTIAPATGVATEASTPNIPPHNGAVAARRGGIVRGRGGTIAALDMGSGKIACFIATHDGGGAAGGITITGIGLQKSAGMRGGEVIDSESLTFAVGRAVEQAEAMAGVTLENVHVGISGGNIRTRRFSRDIRIPGGRVTPGDIAALLGMESAGEDENHAGHELDRGDGIGGSGDTGAERKVIHRIPLQYRVDGVGNIRDAAGMHGQTLGVDMVVATANAGTLGNLGMVVEHNHLKVTGFCASPYAAALGVLVPDERELGAVMLDIGADVTGLAVFAGGMPVYLDSIPLGSRHVTSDIARGLSTPLEEAERIKILHGDMLAATGDGGEVITLPRIGEAGDDAGRQIEPGLLAEIIRPRMDEIFDLLLRRLNAAGFGHAVAGSVILTGGGTGLPHMDDYLARMLERPVRIARPDPAIVAGLPDIACGPAYAAASGILRFAAAERLLEPRPDPAGARAHRGILWRMSEWLGGHI